jgi:GTP:adenosylcobinamide-phosphate guanylyltransferase
VAHAERTVNAVVLAGGAPDDVAATVPGAPNKAFVPIGGVPLVARVIAALRSAPEIGRIVVVAPPATHANPALARADERRRDGARMIESLESGLTGFPPDEPVLVAASDLPVLTAEAIAEFLRGARARDLDVAYAVVHRRDHDARYPYLPHTWARMADGRFCGGGLAALKPRVLPALRSVLDDLGAARKSPLRLATLFGWDILPRFAFGALTIAAAERRASAILGAPAGAIRCSHAETAINVDRPSDVALANGLAAAAAKGVG